MTDRECVIGCAVEWWNCLGRRTKEELTALVFESAQPYAYSVPESTWPELAEEAWRRIPDWKKSARAKGGAA